MGKRFSFVKLQEVDEDVFHQVADEDLDYFEYRNIPVSSKRSYFMNKIRKIADSENNISFALLDNGMVSAAWLIEKDEFDTSIFGIDMYRIQKLLILNPVSADHNEIINQSVNYLQSIVAAKKRKSYFLIGLNSNSNHTSILLNRLILNGFYYLNLLLTFKMFKEEFPALKLEVSPDLVIREAEEKDIGQITRIAGKSFKYSRFHLDPFLDKDKANYLFIKSAENSVLKSFVDMMYVAEIDNEVAGYYSAKKKFIDEFNLTIGESIITAVDEKYRNKGISSGLNNKMVHWYYKNTDIAEFGTYLQNLPMHRILSKIGLSIVHGKYQLSILLSPKGYY